MHRKLSLDFAALAVILGILPLLFLSGLPSSAIRYGVAFFFISLLFVRTKLTVFIAIMLAALLWGTINAEMEIERINRYSEKNIEITGEVKSPDIGNEKAGRILFKVEKAGEKVIPFYHPFIISLNWTEPDMRIVAGQRWKLRVSVRPVHGLMNEGGFNSQRWAMANHLTLSGYVRDSRLLDGKLSLRQRFVDKANLTVSQLDYADILMALAFGERGLVSPQRQQLLLKTGIAHLMAISGLHISLAAMLGFLLARAIQWFFPNRYISLAFPYIFSWLLAFIYMWLSGINPPAMRAMLALTLWLGSRRYCLFCSPWQIWLYIVALLFIYDPLMVLSDSVWLSCSAVAGLIFWFQWFPLKTAFYKKRWFLIRWIHLQSAMTLLLVPLQIAIFQGLSFSSLLSNLIAVPIVSFITVPAILLALLFNDVFFLSYYCWLLADFSLSLFFPIMEKLKAAWLTIEPKFLLFSVMGWLSVIIWRLKLWQTSGIACFSIVMVLFTVSRHRTEYRWRLDMLDVGHGLAVVIHNGRQAVLYDTGNVWDSGSIAERAIVPFLNHHGLSLEGIILSHDDSDHAGGLSWLRQKYPDVWLRTPSSEQGLPCIQGQMWQWRRLRFEVLWPSQQVKRAGNADSCVIKISDDKHSVLLTGDLEKQQELALVRYYQEKLKADILQTPHHGSNSSSTGPFLRQVNPLITLTSISRFNPWRLPSEKVRQRYLASGISWYSTSRAGQISLLFFKDNWQIHQFRQDLSYRWYNQWFGDIPDKD